MTPFECRYLPHDAQSREQVAERVATGAASTRIAELDPRNTASSSVCRRLGMRREAHFREDLLKSGQWHDTVVCAILATEWLAA